MVLPPRLLGTVLDRVLFPAMAHIQSRPDRLLSTYRRGIVLTSLLVLPVSAASLVLANEIVRVLMGPGWGEVVVPLRILALGMFLRSGSKLGDALARATGAVYRRAWRQWLYAALVIGGPAVGQFGGLPGVAAGMLGALLVNYTLTGQLSLSLVGTTWRSFLKWHAAGTWLALIVLAELVPLVHVMRAQHFGAAATLVVSAVLVALTVLVIGFLRPESMLGQDHRWVRNLAASQFTSLMHNKEFAR